MKEGTFERLKTAGHWIGVLFWIVGLYYSFQSNYGWTFFAGFFAYWIINYGLIRGLVEPRVIQSSSNRDSETHIDL